MDLLSFSYLHEKKAKNKLAWLLLQLHIYPTNDKIIKRMLLYTHNQLCCIYNIFT